MVNRRKSQELKKLQGTYRKDRDNPNAPEPSHDLPVAPPTFSDRARSWFETILECVNKQGYASASHTEIYSLTAMRLAEVEQLTETIEAIGPTYETTSTKGDRVQKARPEVAMRNEALRHSHSLLVELGLTPSSVSKISAPPKPQKSRWSRWDG